MKTTNPHQFTQFLVGVALTLAPTVALAQADKGNGGFTAVCGDKVIMFDTYEGYRRGFKADFGAENRTVRQKFKVMENRVRVFLPKLADTLAELAEGMLVDIEEYQQLPVVELPNGVKVRTGQTILWSDDPLRFLTPDTGVGFEPGGGCAAHLTIRNQKVRVKMDRPYEIYTPDWEKMSADERAIGVMHESLYSLFRDRGETDSFFTRYVNQHLFDPRALNMNTCEYFALKHNDTLGRISASVPNIACNEQGELVRSSQEITIRVGWNDLIFANLMVQAGGKATMKFESVDGSRPFTGSLAIRKSKSECVKKRMTKETYYIVEKDMRFEVETSPFFFEILKAKGLPAERETIRQWCKVESDGRLMLADGAFYQREVVPVTADINFQNETIRFSDGEVLGDLHSRGVSLKYREAGILGYMR